MSRILLYLSSTIIVLKYLSSTGWLKAGYGLVMMMMMMIMGHINLLNKVHIMQCECVGGFSNDLLDQMTY